MKYKFIDEKGEHLHTLEDKPLIGTSTVLSVLAKTLTYWASGLAVQKFGWTNSKEVAPDVRLKTVSETRAKISILTDEEYLKLLDEAYKAHATKLKDSATKGTDMHELLEKYVERCIREADGAPIKDMYDGAVDVFSKWAEQNVKKFLACEVHCYSDRFWIGGIVDCIFEDKQGRLCIMDFKSAKEAYMSHFLQIAGYDIQIAENGTFDKDGNQLKLPKRSVDYYAVFPFGMKNPEPQFNYDLVSLREGFLSALTLYKLINK